MSQGSQNVPFLAHQISLVLSSGYILHLPFSAILRGLVGPIEAPNAGLEGLAGEKLASLMWRASTISHITQNTKKSFKIDPCLGEALQSQIYRGLQREI